MSSRIDRRQFLKRTATAAFLAGVSPLSAGPRKLSANDKLNIGVIGVANRGRDNLNGVAAENIVALCDVDEKLLGAAAEKFPSAKTYVDFRKLIDQKDLDAIVISTPDHTHAVAAVAALKSGRHLYCEKPLTRTVSECRRVRELAARGKLVTQLGSQIHAGNNYRRVVELIQSGVIGQVDEVHVWVNAVYAGKRKPRGPETVPTHLHYDLWLGPVPPVPYSPEHVPFLWRHWWAFGGGGLADFGCHFMDLPHWALELRYPTLVEPLGGPPVEKDTTPEWMIVRFSYPARGQKPPVKLTWYHGGKQPDLLTPEQAAKWKAGVLFVGKKGSVLSNYDRHVLLPEKEFSGFKPPEPFIPNSIGHHREWIEACKTTGGPTTCNFDYSGALTETVLLGNVAYRAGKTLEWDANKLRATNCREADEFIQHHYRKGWKI